MNRGERAAIEKMGAEGRFAYGYPEAAEKLNVSVRTILRLIKAGELCKIKAGARALVTRRSLEAFIERGGSANDA